MFVGKLAGDLSTLVEHSHRRPEVEGLSAVLTDVTLTEEILM